MTGIGSGPARIRRISQVALGAIWLIDGALQCQPALFGRALITDVILPNAAGQPGIVASPLRWMGHQIEPHVAVFNALAATLQVMIGLGLVYRRTVKPALVVSFLWAAAVWFAGEGFGGILTGAANPLTGAPGAASLYIVVGLMVWPRQADGERSARVAWAALWLSCAGLWLLPANDSTGSVHDAIASAPSGAGWLSGVLDAAASATTGRGTAIAIAMAALSAAIALSILTRTAERTFLGVAIALSLAYWVVGQGVGGILTGGATDLSTAPLVVLMGSILLAHTSLPRRDAPVGFAVASPAATSVAA
jgi:hypothetical protein